MMCTFKAIVCPPSQWTIKPSSKRHLNLAGQVLHGTPIHACPGHTHQVLWGAVYPSSHMVEAPPHKWGGEAGGSSSSPT